MDRLLETVDIAELEAQARPRMLDWDQVREMHGQGFDFQNHTASHTYLNELPPAEAESEITRAHEAIHRELGVTARYLAFPDGRISPNLIDLLRQLGYSRAFSTEQHLNWPAREGRRLILGRVGASKDFRGLTGRVSDSIICAELLGVWDVLFLRRWRYRQSVIRNGA